MTRRPHLLTVNRGFLLLGVLLATLMLTNVASAQPYPRGFNPPDDWEEQLLERRMVYPLDRDELPPSFDWRDLGGVTPVRDQGSCGSCWAFAATGEMEAKIKIHYGLTLNLSEQQILSCNPYGDGCDGGWAGSAYYVFMHYGGVLENCMPYESDDTVACRQDQFLKFTTMDTWTSVANNADQIKMAIMQNGPVCTGVGAYDAWDGYDGGIIDTPNYGVNHLVLIVGWDDRMGDHGAWIIKNSWGAGWGDAGYCYVAYGASSTGVGVTSLTYTPPPVEVGVSSPSGDLEYYGDDMVEITWYTENEDVDTVDLYYGTVGACQDEVIALGVPNTGSYQWQIPNVSTTRATVLVFPSEGTERGYGFSEGEFTIIGHQTRYVSASGSNTPPFDSPARAAHSVAAAVLAGAGRDTILIAAGDYLESQLSINSQAHLIGGWNADFTIHDSDTYTTRLRGATGTLSFNITAGDYCGVSHVTFRDAQGWNMADPVAGRHGSAIVVMGASPVIEHCVFENNRAAPNTGPGWGGAIMAHQGSPVVRDCLFTGNIGSQGGALALSQCTDALVQRCDFLANSTSDSTGTFHGAAIYVSGGTAHLEDLTLQGGGAGAGGGLFVTDDAVVSASDLAVRNNRARVNGGGIQVSGADLELVCSEVSGNRATTGSGAGIYADASELDLRNSLVMDNVAAVVAGGIYGQNLTAGGVQHCVLHGNEAGSMGGMLLSTASPFVVTDNVVTANIGGGVMAAGASIMSAANLAFGNQGGDFLSAPGEGDLVADPLFADPDDGDFAPLLHSPLVDSGSGLAGDDWDGGAADRGLHGGALGVAGGPARVTGLVGSFAAGTASLSWDAVDGAVAYTVYRDSSTAFVPAPDRVCATITDGSLGCIDVPPAGDWYYLVTATDAAGHMGGLSQRWETSGGSNTPVEPAELPVALQLTGVTPNPFNPRTTVHFALPADARVRLAVYDLRGHRVATLHDGQLAAGPHAILWDGADDAGRGVATGVYLVRLDDGRSVVTRKAVLAR